MKRRPTLPKIIFSIVSLGAISVFIIYVCTVFQINKDYHQRYQNTSVVSLRKFPYPYRAATAICSDLDGTTSREEFLEIQRFLHTDRNTSLGTGVCLEIGGSIFMYEPPSDSISYFSGGPLFVEDVTKLAHAGFIDFLHSYGKKSDFTRSDAISSLQELTRRGIKFDVWVDHTKTIDNLGDDRTFGLGDHPGTPAYHADLTIAHGFKFFWLGRVTMIAGQSVPVNLQTFLTIFDSNHPFFSALNISKEFAKHLLGVFGNKKYAMHKANDLLRIVELDDGQKVYEFIRYDNYWRGVGTGAYCSLLPSSLSTKNVQRIKDVGGFAIVYTHLGMNSDCSDYIPADTRAALKNLAKEYQSGEIYVTTTSRLLNYFLNHKYLNWSHKEDNGKTVITIKEVSDPVFGSFVPTQRDLQGITFYVPRSQNTLVLIGDNEVASIQRNPSDSKGRESVTIPRVSLQFPL